MLSQHPKRQVQKRSAQNKRRKSKTLSPEEGWHIVTRLSVQRVIPFDLGGYTIIYRAEGTRRSEQTEMRQSVSVHCI